jgi:hypothetical protein
MDPHGTCTGTIEDFFSLKCLVLCRLKGVARLRCLLLTEEADMGSSADSGQTIFENLHLKEKAELQFLFGPATVTVSSCSVDCLFKFIECMNNHEYEPYSKSRPGEASFAASYSLVSAAVFLTVIDGCYTTCRFTVVISVVKFKSASKVVIGLLTSAFGV